MTGPDVDCTCDAGRISPACPVHGAPAHNRAPPDPYEWIDRYSKPSPNPIKDTVVRAINEAQEVALDESRWIDKDRISFARGQIAGALSRAIAAMMPGVTDKALTDIYKQLADEIAEPVALGSIWEHHSGRIYTVYDITNESSEYRDKYPLTFSYVGQNGKKWSGRADDWHRRMKLLRFEPNEK